MEFVGRTVKKEFQGFGVFAGTIKSFDPSSGLFEIVYEDGDSEDMDLAEITVLLGGMAGESGSAELNQKPRVGRKPKKRRRVEAKREVCGHAAGNVSDNMMNDGHFGSHNVLSETLEREWAGAILQESYSGSGNSKQSVCADVINLNDRINLNDGIDAHDGFDLNNGLNSKEELNLNVEFVEKVKRSESIDLNLDANGDCDANVDGGDSGSLGMKVQKRECHFDLNLGFDDEMKNADNGYGENFEGNTSLNEEIGGVGRETEIEGGGMNRNFVGPCLKIAEGIPVRCGNSIGEHVLGDSCVLSVDDIQNEYGVLGESLNRNASFSILDANHVKDGNFSEVQVKGGFGESVAGHQGDFRHTYKGGNIGRKRRKLADASKPTTEVVLRRSRRRGSILMSAHNHAASTTKSHTLSDISSSPAVSTASEGKPFISGCEGPEEHSELPPKVQLPPSSQNLNLDGIPILDVFSVYACLRSFSTSLFLSPFEFEDFVAVLKCEYSTYLFDFIHVSLLQTLRKHLEFLSVDGSQSAVYCLRTLNWSLLDLITWPVFVANYLLIHSSGLKCGFDLNCLKLFDRDYYKQPAHVKVEVLRCLCDDVIEVEAIKAELSRRLWTAEPDSDFDRNVNSETCKKKRIDALGGTYLMQEVVEETTDWNSDECCLCKMDGSLICCDGCPAAYHTKCVGVANDLLPEGDWYCPECVIDKNKQMKLRKSLRGAELLGIDPHGRLYFGCCDYLLVSDSCDADSSSNYYQSNDLNVVIEVLKSSHIHYDGILSGISKHWNIPVSLFKPSTNMNSQIHTICSEACVKVEKVGDKALEQISVITSNSGYPGSNFSKSVNIDSVAGTHHMDMEKPYTSSEGSAEITQASTGIQNFQKQGPDCSNASCENLNQSLTLALTSISLDIKQEKDVETAVPGHTSSIISPSKGNASSQVQLRIGYMNCYSFAQTASSVAEELMHKSSNKINENSIMSVEEIISAQLKVILKKSTKFCWPSIQNLTVDAQKENCGWCFSCKVPSDDRDCLFKMCHTVPVSEVSKNEVASVRSKRDKKGHLVDVVCHIMSIEDRLRGLLIGPWMNPNYSKIWRKTVLKSPNIASVKHLLLTLESNLHRLALSDDWLKHVDSFVTVGSASHVVTSSPRVSSKHGISRKRAKNSESVSNSSANIATGLGIFWWRGGRLSCQLFSWKVLPRLLVSKAARQAGCTKIPGILYPDNSDFAKRSKHVAWRAAVETATSVEQLAYQIRDFDLNIRWDDIENTHLLPLLGKESKKSIRAFKKVVIRRKSCEGTAVKYLLDFGKRRIIPNIVLRYGSILEESSSGRKKYWLDESHVPLNLLKAFEDKRIARKSTSTNSRKLHESVRIMKKPFKKRDFSYLFSKAQRSENYQCGHCNKDVLISEAVSCQYCEGFFHRRHVRKSAGAITAECTYACHKCQNGRYVKAGSKRRKAQSQKSKIASVNSRPVRSKKNKKACTSGRLVRAQDNQQVSSCVPLRRSARKIKCKSLQEKKRGRGKKGKQSKSKKATSKPRKGASWQKKRTKVCHSYWLNGLHFSGKPNDERLMHFRREKLLVSSEHAADVVDLPKCCLCCEAGYTSKSSFISCDICGDWFHGDAFGLDVENIDNLIGFRCHKCCKRSPPVCPHLQVLKSDVAQFDEMKSKAGPMCVQEVSTVISPPSEQLVAGPSSNQDSMTKSNLEEGKEHLPANEQKADANQNSGCKDLKPDLLCEPSGSLILEENTNSSGKESVAVVDVELSASKPDVDVLDMELKSLAHNEPENALVKTTI
ncbi:DDT domain-containing protein PTM isoform X2 [Malania oleifera]|uniref:DDT domain-containing protein PTM isoform X2 n=1 Tax=Malania oleifera TaxID=397392 RepID=UPI0025AE098B|nr:DDT domain-containing protein PTM isoform X2 [Malania oleifera]